MGTKLYLAYIFAGLVTLRYQKLQLVCRMILGQTFVLIFLLSGIQADCVSLNCSFCVHFVNFDFLKNGYYHIFTNTTNCGDDSAVIKWINSSVEVTEKCEVFLTSCALLKPFQSTDVTRICKHDCTRMIFIYI